MNDGTALPPNQPTAVAAAVVPATEPARGRNVVCEFCESTLAPDGSYLKMGERAKELRKADEKMANLRAEIARLESEVSRLTGELAAATAVVNEREHVASDRY
jgi:septal ring factor EnvC (AmiA/AmiB activator)